MDVLLNWLMQGVVVAIATAAGLRIIPSPRAQARYGFVWVAYLLVMVLPIVPIAVAALAIEVPPVDLAPVSAGAVDVPVAWWRTSAVPLWLWIAWSGFQVAQFTVGAVAVRRARRQSQECPRDVLSRLPHWSHLTTTGRPTRVILSDRVRFAAVLGCGSPIIALAPGLLAQLSADDLDRVLVHEWAHVQRRDDLAQLLQQLVRAVVGWHPAAWWLERQLEFEREVACDEIAVGVTRSAKSYAACLVTLAALPQRPARSLPGLAAISTPQLRRRVVRILSARWNASTRGWRVGAACGAIGLAALALAVSHVRALPPMPRSTNQSAITPRMDGPSAAAGALTQPPHVEPAPPQASATLRRKSSEALPHVREHEPSRVVEEPSAIQESIQHAGPSEGTQTIGLPSGTPVSPPFAAVSPEPTVDALVRQSVSEDPSVQSPADPAAQTSKTQSATDLANALGSDRRRRSRDRPHARRALASRPAGSSAASARRSPVPSEVSTCAYIWSIPATCRSAPP